MKSPCRHICKIDSKTGFCEGCYRTLDEILHWKDMTIEERQKIILEEIPKRHIEKKT